MAKRTTSQKRGPGAAVAGRKRLSGEERRAAILDSALAVFAERGYHASSLDDIAGAGGVSKALIYEHFDSKQVLYAELLEHHTAMLFERLAAAIAEAGPGSVDRLAAGLDAFYAFVEDHRVAWRLLFRETSDPEAAALLDRVVAQVTALVAALIAEDPASRTGAEDEETRRQGIEMLAQMLVGSVQSLANWWADNQRVPRRQILELTMDFAWHGLERLSRGERWLASPP